ncbi:MAG: flagellar motor protein MotB [Candidatus Thiodiazotropha sp. (ex Epidulcina cf. delphinae)]|nr:flagellar motor protein MotB [Candidatus Thiodiazotropha sp. (ex Epidulcina cf. delphinae)]
MVSTTGKADPLDAISWYTWETEETDAGWLLIYVDVLSVILAMLVVLLGQMAVQHLPPLEDENGLATSTLEPPVMAEPVEFRQPQAMIEPQQEAVESVTAEDRLVSAIETRFQGEVKIVQREQGISLEIADVILFNSGKAKLLPEAQPVLSRLAKTLQEIGDANISVEGHTDDRPIMGGRFQSNWELAAARANAVTRFLLNQGFSTKRLRSVSYADAHPAADNSNPAGRAENRRVNLRVEFL